MATTTTTPERPVRTRTGAKVAEPGTLDFLQKALEDLNLAREHAQKDAQDGIDDATERIRAAVFERAGVITLQERAMPSCGPTDAIVRVTMTTICGTDVHILKGEYPVAPGRIIGHEPVGVIHELGSAVVGYEVGDRVLCGAITPCGSCFFCQHGDGAQCSGTHDEWEMIGGWRLGNSADGVQADFFRVPYAQANLARIPDDMTDEQCLMLADIASTGISAAETADVQIGHTVAVFAQGPIGL